MKHHQLLGLNAWKPSSDLALQVPVGSGCPSVGGQRALVVHRSKHVHALALPAAKPVLGWGSGIGFAHAASGGALRLRASASHGVLRGAKFFRFGTLPPNPAFKRTGFASRLI